MNSPHSIKFSLSSEIGDIDQETTHSCNSLRGHTEIAPPSFDNNPLFDTLLDQTGHIRRVSNTGRDYSPELYPNSLLLSQPDGRNTWTLSLDPTISHPVAISESSAELESLSLLSSCASEEAIARPFSSVSSTPKHNASLSLPPSQDDIAKFSASSDVSIILSSTPSVQQQQTSSVPFNTENADLYFSDLPHGLVSHCQPPLDSVLDRQQTSRSKNLIKKSKNIFGRFKKLFKPKGTISEDIHAHTAHHPKFDPIAAMPPVSERRRLPSYQRYRLTKSTMSLTPSFGQSFTPENSSLADNNVDEKYTYEYHARPKTLKEIKSQRRFSLPMVFGTSSHVTPSTKRNVTTSFSRPQSRPMSIYIASQNATLDFAA